MAGVGQSLKAFREGTLRSSDGKVVKDRKQAVAIGLSEERKSKIDAAVAGLAERKNVNVGSESEDKARFPNGRDL